MEALFNILIAVAVMLGLGVIGGIVFGASDGIRAKRTEEAKPEEKSSEVH